MLNLLQTFTNLKVLLEEHWRRLQADDSTSCKQKTCKNICKKTSKNSSKFTVS